MWGKVDWLWARFLVVALVLFFGAAFSIMSFHEDVAIKEMIERLYKLFGMNQKETIPIFEYAYTVGLASGILIFFGKIGWKGRKQTPVAMKIWQYKNDVKAYEDDDYDDENGD